MFGKVFDTMYTGSMVGAGSTVFALMPYAVTHCNADGFVELNPKLIGPIFGEPVETVEAAITYLCAPDPDSRSEDEEGRRMVKEGPFLYRLVNHGKYRNLRDAEAQRASTRERVRKHRQKMWEERTREANKEECNGPVTQCNAIQRQRQRHKNPPKVPPRGTVFSQKKKRLFPIPGKNCKCGLPAIYATNDAYPKYLCGEHMPDEVKELYE